LVFLVVGLALLGAPAVAQDAEGDHQVKIQMEEVDEIGTSDPPPVNIPSGERRFPRRRPSSW